jgi:hypothetical protein
MDNKKLYECRYEIIYYVMAENTRQASTYLNDAADNDPFEISEVSVHQFGPDDAIDEKWEKPYLIYGDCPDGFTLGDAVELVKSRVKDDRQMEFSFVKEK